MAACVNNDQQKSADDNRGIADHAKASCLPANDETGRKEMWQPVGEFSVLNRKKCRHLYAKAGKRKDLALFYDEGKFYAMEAWCSHMGKWFCILFIKFQWLVGNIFSNRHMNHFSVKILFKNLTY